MLLRKVGLLDSRGLLVSGGDVLVRGGMMSLLRMIGLVVMGKSLDMADIGASVASTFTETASRTSGWMLARHQRIAAASIWPQRTTMDGMSEMRRRPCSVVSAAPRSSNLEGGQKFSCKFTKFVTDSVQSWHQFSAAQSTLPIFGCPRCPLVPI